MIFNIIDRREKKYNWKRVSAIIEPVWQNNGMKNGDNYTATPEQLAEVSSYKQISECSVAIAVDTAMDLPYPCTLFLYDLGRGIDVSVVQPIEKVLMRSIKSREESNLNIR